MRRKIAAANWKMNGTYQQAEALLNEVLQAKLVLPFGREVIFAVPFPYLIMANSVVAHENNYHISAQNCHHEASGAYTGEVSAEMLRSVGIRYCIVGHSERREYFGETGSQLAAKLNQCFQHGITPIFCCGEPLPVRESGQHLDFVRKQLEESLFHLSADQLKGLVIAYEPVWAIGTGKTASTAQAQEMHATIRAVLAGRWGSAVAGELPILYGGSVKASNAGELFAAPDVDGGLVGGASLVAAEFVRIIEALVARE